MSEKSEDKAREDSQKKIVSDQVNLDKRRIDFLIEYEVLCSKYKIYLDGCGCCNSPYVEDASRTEDLPEHFKHLKETLC